MMSRLEERTLTIRGHPYLLREATPGDVAVVSTILQQPGVKACFGPEGHDMNLQPDRMRTGWSHLVAESPQSEVVGTTWLGPNRRYPAPGSYLLSIARDLGEDHKGLGHSMARTALAFWFKQPEVARIGAYAPDTCDCGGATLCRSLGFKMRKVTPGIPGWPQLFGGITGAEWTAATGGGQDQPGRSKK